MGPFLRVRGGGGGGGDEQKTKIKMNCHYKLVIKRQSQYNQRSHLERELNCEIVR